MAQVSFNRSHLEAQKTLKNMLKEQRILSQFRDEVQHRQTCLPLKHKIRDKESITYLRAIVEPNKIQKEIEVKEANIRRQLQLRNSTHSFKQTLRQLQQNHVNSSLIKQSRYLAQQSKLAEMAFKMK